MSADIAPLSTTLLATKKTRLPALFSPDAQTVKHVLEFFTTNQGAQI